MASWRIVRALQAKDDAKKAAKREKVADRPHAWTIVLGLFGPSLALVALVVSILSLRSNERNTRIGQRAYLVMNNTTLKVELNQDREHITPSVQLDAYINFDVVNLGNTPALIDSLKLTIEPSEKDWWQNYDEHSNYENEVVKLGNLAPKATQHESDIAHFDLTVAAMERIAGSHSIPDGWWYFLSGSFRVKSVITYHDVFGESASVGQCMLMDAAINFVDSYSCD